MKLLEEGASDLKWEVGASIPEEVFPELGLEG